MPTGFGIRTAVASWRLGRFLRLLDHRSFHERWYGVFVHHPNVGNLGIVFYCKDLTIIEPGCHAKITILVPLVGNHPDRVLCQILVNFPVLCLVKVREFAGRFVACVNYGVLLHIWKTWLQGALIVIGVNRPVETPLHHSTSRSLSSEASTYEHCTFP